MIFVSFAELRRNERRDLLPLRALNEFTGFRQGRQRPAGARQSEEPGFKRIRHGQRLSSGATGRMFAGGPLGGDSRLADCRQTVVYMRCLLRHPEICDPF